MPHRHASNLTEGMREGDLADLVLPLISVDEYVSKVDEDQAIVFGFYVHDQAAANDLNRFLQKSAVPILDTDVSPAPDQHGYYMVFVELTNNDRLTENVGDILAEIEGLVEIEDWQMRVRDLDDLIPFSAKNLIKAMKTTEDIMAENTIIRFLQPSVLEAAYVGDNLLILEGSGERFVFDIIGFDDVDRLLATHELRETAITYDFHTVARTNRIARVLGEGWDVMKFDHYLILHRNTDPRGLLLQ